MGVRYLTEFLKCLETKVPTPPNGHHSIHYAQYGNDAEGWEDRLAISVFGPDGKWTTFFLGPEDESKISEELAAEIAELMEERRCG